jgi:hypothetical protein
LYVYGDVGAVPEGVAVLDGRTILPEERICRYGPAAGPGEGSLALFSNLFRYALLERHGGIWSDCDMVCLKPLGDVAAADYVIATEYGDRGRQIALANACLLKAPAGSPFIAECNAIAISADTGKSAWGELGPSMLTVVVRKHALERFIAPPWWSPRSADGNSRASWKTPSCSGPIRRLPCIASTKCGAVPGWTRTPAIAGTRRSNCSRHKT